RQRLGAADEFTGDRIARPVLADAVLHAEYLAALQAAREGRDDATVMRRVAIAVGVAFPHAHRGEMRRLQAGRLPLVHRVVGNAVDADLSVRPWLGGGPFDAVVEVLRLARIVMVELARRAAGAAAVDTDADETVRHPLLGIDHFPVHVLVGR